MIPAEIDKQWRGWVEQAIGGPAERIEATMRTVVAAIESGRAQDEIVAAADHAAQTWDAQHPRLQRSSHKHKILKFVMSIVVITTIGILMSEHFLRHPPVILDGPNHELTIAALIGSSIILALIGRKSGARRP